MTVEALDRVALDRVALDQEVMEVEAMEAEVEVEAEVAAAVEV